VDETPTWAEAVVPLDITGALAAAAIVMLIVALFTTPPDVIETVPLNVPAAVGVPVIKPELELIASPPGRPVAP
jgi:hypothetical protein